MLSDTVFWLEYGAVSAFTNCSANKKALNSQQRHLSPSTSSCSNSNTAIDSRKVRTQKVFVTASVMPLVDRSNLTLKTRVSGKGKGDTRQPQPVAIKI
jgi:hypothetical protein